MILALFAAIALQAAPPPAAPDAQNTRAAPTASVPSQGATRANRRSQPVCENRPRTGSVLRRDICVSAQQAASQQSVAKQHIEEATAGIAHTELPLGGAYNPLNH